MKHVRPRPHERNFLKRPYFFRVNVAFNSGKQFKKDTSFGELIQWFRVDERPIRVKRCGIKNTGIGVDVGLDNE